MTDELTLLPSLLIVQSSVIRMFEIAPDMFLVVAASLLVIAALHDAATRTIPDWTAACLALFGFLLRIVSGEVLLSLCIAFAILTGLGFLWLRGFLGGGDVKLMAAASLAIPPAAVAAFVLNTALAGGVLAIVYLALGFLVHRPSAGMRHSFLGRVLKAEAWRIHRRGPIPYGAAVAAAGMMSLLPLMSE